MKRNELKSGMSFRSSDTYTATPSYTGFASDDEFVETSERSKETVRHYSLWHWVLPPCILSLFTAAWYYPSLHFAFQFDDLANIVKFFDIRHKTFTDLFMTSSRWISAWLNTLYYKIGKFDPWAYRVGNVIEHTLAGFLLFFVFFIALSRLKKHSFFKEHAWSISVLSAALFLLHPVQTQTVSYVIQGQLEGLSGLFMIAISFCFLSAYAIRNRIARTALVCVMYGLLILAMGTKEISIVSPVLLLILDWFFVSQGDIDDLKKRKFLHLGVAVCVFATYFYLVKPHYFFSLFSREVKNNIGNVLTDHPATTIKMSNYFISQFKVILHYMALFVWPFMMSVDYDWKISRSFFAPDSFFPFLMLLALGVYTLYRLRKNKTDLISAAILWFFVAILPRASIIPSTELIADYKTYLSSVAVMFLMASGLVWVVQRITPLRNARWAQAVLAVSCIGILGYLTYQRNLVWQSATHFWEDIIRHAPMRARAYNNYGVALSEKGEYHKAIENFKKAIAMDRNYSDPCNNIAVAYSALGQLDNAIAAIRQSIRIQPYYPEGYNNLASFLMQKREYDQIEAILQTALKLRPHYGKAYFNLGRYYLERGDKQKAVEALKNACCKADFDNETGFGSYASLSLQLGNYDDAVFGYKKAIDCNPRNPEHIFGLANTYFMKKEYAQALALYKQVQAMQPNELRFTYNLGEAYFAMRDYAAAITCYTHVIERDPRAHPAHMRVAECHLALGNKAEARRISSALQQPDVPQIIKDRAAVIVRS